MQKSIPLIAVLLSAAGALLSAAGCVATGDPSQEVQSTEAALCAPTKLTLVGAASSPSPKQSAANAIDGNTGTRWESAYSDPQWIYVDLGSVKTVTEVRIDWQHAAAKDYRIDVSNDGVNWGAPVVTRTGGAAVDHRIDDLTGFSVSARYIRIYGTARATVYGYSIWELTVYDGTSCGGTGAGGSGGAAGGAAGAAGGGAGSAGSAAGSGGAGSGGSCASVLLTSPSTPAVSSPSPKQAASKAVDGNTGTRWESAYSDPQWIYVDLGSVKTITEVRIDWQHAAAKDYRIDVSSDAVTWSAPVATRTGGAAVDHRIDDIAGLSASGRYVRVYGTARATVYGYSIWELQVFGSGGSSCATNLLTAGWDPSTVFTNYTPATGFTFGPGKNAISFDYRSTTYSTSATTPIFEVTQMATIPQAGSKWRLTFSISGMNNQASWPPQFFASLGTISPTGYSPASVSLNVSGRFINVGSLTSGGQLTADFTASFNAGDSVQVFIDDVPGLAADGTGQQAFNVTDVSLTRLQ